MALHLKRSEYTRDVLVESRAPRDPLRLFDAWFRRALSLDGPDRNAVVLATSGARGRPSARMVLLKDWSAAGFVFGTNFHSRKGRDIAANPQAALLFYWPELERQVRVEGPIRRLSDPESDAIFLARPRLSRLGAIASPQSAVISSRAVLERAVARLNREHDGQDVRRPPHWGGYRLVPREFEFWQGRPDRLHDRLRFRRSGRAWKRERLAP